MRLALLPVLALTFLTACRSGPSEANPLELRTYEVPKGTVRALTTTIKDALTLDEKTTIGRATVTPDGRLAVLAPQNVQANVQQLIEEVASHPPKYDQTIELHYWVVLGKPMATPQPPVPGAGEIQPALDEIVKSQGPQAFTVAQRVQLSSLHDEKSVVESEKLRVIQMAVQTSDGVYARIDIQFEKGNNLETRVRLLPDRIVVLGAIGQRGGDAADGATLYYVVRLAPRVDGKQP